MGWIASAAVSPGYIGSRGHQSTDKRSTKHQDVADRERFKKEIESPMERLQREKMRARALGAEKPDPELMGTIREFSEPRAEEKGTGG